VAVQRFTDLKVWQQGHALVLKVYHLTRALPPDERFGLVAQLRRAALSVPTNSAEGSKRQSRQEYAHFLNIAEGSLVETEYLLMVSRDLGFLEPKAVSAVLSEIDGLARMLHNLRTKVGQRDERSSTRQQ